MAGKVTNASRACVGPWLNSLTNESFRRIHAHVMSESDGMHVNPRNLGGLRVLFITSVSPTTHVAREMSLTNFSSASPLHPSGYSGIGAKCWWLSGLNRTFIWARKATLGDESTQTSCFFCKLAQMLE